MSRTTRPIPDAIETFNSENPELWKFFIPASSLAQAWAKKNAAALPEGKEEKKEEKSEIAPSQVKWGKLCDAAAKNIANELRKKTPLTQNLFDFFLQMVTGARKTIAEELKHPIDYGQPRVSMSSDGKNLGNKNLGYSGTTAEELECTVMCEKIIKEKGISDPDYSDQFDFLKTRISELDETEDTEHFSAHFHIGTHRKKDYRVREIAIYGNGIDENGKEEKLLYSALTLTNLGDDTDGYIYTDHMRNQKDLCSALRYANRIYQEILLWKDGDDPYELIRKIGLLSWHMYNIMPLKNGTCSAIEIMVSAILQSHLIVPVKSLNRVSLDFRAFATPNPDDFADYFCRLYPFKRREEKKEEKVRLKSVYYRIIPTKLPEEDNLSTHTDPKYPQPLLINKAIPQTEKSPNPWRRDDLRLLMNRKGFSTHATGLAEYSKNEASRVEDKKEQTGLLLHRSSKIFDWIDNLSDQERQIFCSVMKSPKRMGVLEQEDIDFFKKIMLFENLPYKPFGKMVEENKEAKPGGTKIQIPMQCFPIAK